MVKKLKKNKYWFKSKRFGWGFVPISWEGWLFILAMIILISISVFVNKIYLESACLENGLSFLLDFVLILLVSIQISIKKSRDKPRWRWGK